MMLQLFTLVVLAAELVGLALLAREVHRGHEAETIEAEQASARRLLDLHAKGASADFLRELWLSRGSSSESAEGWIRALAPDTLRQAADDALPLLRASVERWERHTSKAWQKLRKRDLLVGTILLMLAAVLRVVEPMLHQP